MILFEWLTNEHKNPIFHEQNRKKWVEIMLIERKSTNFMFKGKKTMWNGLKSSHKQNTDNEALKRRVDRVNEFYVNPEEVAQDNGIQYNTGDDFEVNEEETY